ncbi:MAG: HAD-IA family hydrolase [Nitrososphaerota archaeon]
MLKMNQPCSIRGHKTKIGRILGKQIREKLIPIVSDGFNMQIELVTFDLYGTLVDWKYSISRALNYIHENLADRFFEIEYETVTNLGKYIPYSRILVKVLERALRECKIDFREEYGRLLLTSFAKSPFFPDALIGLILLKKHGYKTGIISNTDRDLVEITLAGVRDFFDYVVTAQDAGYYKPDKRAFITAYEIMKTNYEQVLHVSSYPQYDLEPADQLGVKTVCIDRYGYSWKEKIQSIDRLLEVIRRQW